MGTLHLRAALATVNLIAVREYLARTELNAPVLDLDRAVLLLPCGGTLGWFDDHRHREHLAHLETLGARIVTLTSDVEGCTCDETTTGEWLSASTDPSWRGTGDARSEAQVPLPINALTLHLTLSVEPPAQGCAISVPPGLDFQEARWSGNLVDGLPPS